MKKLQPYALFASLCDLLAKSPDDPKAPQDLTDILAQARANAVHLAATYGGQDPGTWIKTALPTACCEILAALPERPPLSIKLSKTAHPNSWAYKGSPEFILLMISRGVDLTGEVDSFLYRAMSQRMPDIEALLYRRPEWHAHLLREVLCLHGNRRGAHADFVERFVLHVVDTDPGLAQKTLNDYRVRNNPAATVILLSAGVTFPTAEAEQRFSRIASNHRQLKLLKHGRNIAALCRDRDLLKDAREILADYG